MTAGVEPLAEGQNALRAQQSPKRWRDALRSVLRQRSAIVGLAMLSALALLAVFAQQLTPYGVQQTFETEGFIQRAGPCVYALGCPTTHSQHFFGLDANYRDVFTRVLYGGRVSLLVGFETVGFAIVVGSFLGAVAGYAGRLLDSVIMRAMDVLLVFPSLILAIAVVTVLGRGLINAQIAIGIVAIPVYARIMRASVLSVREQDFVTASRALGEQPIGILTRRVLPNSLTPVIVAGTLGIGSAVLDVAALQYLGLGDPSIAEWGSMIGNEGNSVFNAPHLLFFPAIALTLAVLGFNLLGDGSRDAFDPRLNR